MSDPASPAARLGDDAAFRLLTELVSIAPTNLEDVTLDRYEKPNYRRATEAIVRWARSFGLATRLYDPLLEAPDPREFREIPRPNVIVDLDRGAPETVLILGHYDVVPVPEEQRSRWRSPPHALTLRSDGRLYGRGSNDDLGSGITASLLAMRRLAENDALSKNVRLLACCDEETGGEGGIEALRARDARLVPDDGARFLTADVALIPDGSPHMTVGSSGLAFLEASFRAPVPLSSAVAWAGQLVELHDLARTWTSVCESPDWPDRGAPSSVITGRATVTKFDIDRVSGTASTVHLTAAHAESLAGNQIPRAVTLVFQGPAAPLAALAGQLTTLVPAPFRLEPAGSSSVAIPSGALALQIIGTAGHAGYPHRAHNPVPVAIDVLKRASERGWVDPLALGTSWSTVDLRLPPEMELETGLAPALDRLRLWAKGNSPTAEVTAPPARARPGYALSPTHPEAVRLERIIHDIFGTTGFLGEYGGTDASSLRGLTTSRGAPLPALVFGSMDTAAQIHDVDESADPSIIAGVARTIERFILTA